MEITLTDLEEAINYWRRQRPASGEECALSPEVNTLAGLYAMMIFEHVATQPVAGLSVKAQALIQAWRNSQDDQNAGFPSDTQRPQSA
jgi:hypothetical protein